MTVAILKVNETSITDENTKPYLLPKPQTVHKVIAGQEWSYQLGRVNDFEGNKVTASAVLRNAKSFVKFDPESMTLSIERDTTDVQTQPVFDIRIILQDDHPRDPLSRSYDLKIVIVKDWKDPIETLLEDAQKNEVIVEYGEQVYDLTETSVDSLIEANPLDDF